jgi:alanine racemase
LRPTYAEIDLGAIRHNVGAFKDLLAPSELCVVVKADAYGHGDAPVAEAAMEAGATWLAVALLEEGIRLREAEIETPIIVLSEPDPRDAIEIAKWGLTPTVYTPTFVEALAETGAGLDLHIKVDTGMHRVGIAPTLLGELMTTIGAHKSEGRGSLDPLGRGR